MHRIQKENSIFSVIGALLMSALLSPLVYASTVSDTRYFTAEDVFGLEYASDPQVSPDGKQIVYVRRSFDIMHDTTRSSIWIVDDKAKDHRAVLSGQANYHSPVWAPDNNRLAYISNQSGSAQIHVRWMDTGQTALLTNLAETPSNLKWSPDGKMLVFTMSIASNEKPFSVSMPAKPEGAQWAEDFTYVTRARYLADGRGILEPAFTHIFVVPADGGTARQLTSGDFHHRGGLSWSADSQKVYFSANRSDDWEYETTEADIYSITLQGELTQLTHAAGAETDPVVSPDGRYIAYAVRDDKKLAYRNQFLYVMNSDGGNSRNLTSKIDNQVSNFRWKENSGVYFEQMVKGQTQVDFVSLDGRITHVVKNLGGQSLGRPYTSGDYDVAKDTIAFTRGSHQRPADIFIHKYDTTIQATALNEDVLGHKTLADIVEFTYQSSIDGEQIHGWYLLPPDYQADKKYPLILEIHGGPHLAYGPQFSAELQRMAAQGYVVFYNNHRGSSGYGERFALLLQNKYSSEYDFADHMSGIDVLIAKGLVDPNQLFITGGSAGGIATAYAIGLTDRFKAAVVAKPVINWISKVLTADSGLYQIPHQFPGLPWDEIEHYWKRSPLSLVANVNTPTMLITGEEDKRTPMSETEQYYQALKLRKVETLLVRVPGASHAIASKPSRLVGKIEHILAWFEKYRSHTTEP